MVQIRENIDKFQNIVVQANSNSYNTRPILSRRHMIQS